MNTIESQRKTLLTAGTATLLFAAITTWTRYPFLVDDYVFLWQSYLPDFSLLNFKYLLTQRPLATVQNYLWYKFHVFEKTHALFWIYYFLHSLGFLGIFHWIVLNAGSDRLKKNSLAPGILAIALITALYPGWYELTLMASSIPFSLGVPLLALALYASRWWSRILFLVLCFASLETYVLPAFLLLNLPVLAKFPSMRGREFATGILRASFTWFVAAFTFLVLEKILIRLNHTTTYVINVDPAQLLSTGWLYFRMLWTQQFYKANWISSAIEWFTVLGVSIALIYKDRKLGWTVFLALAIPILGAAHSLVLNNYFAPRAIHGAMILKAAFIALLLSEYSVRARSRFWRTAPLCLLAMGYLGHHAFIVHNRGLNARVIEAKFQTIEQDLRTCRPPCTIHAENLNQGLRWDWMMIPMYHEAVVRWLALRNGIHKEIIVLTQLP